jgi:hypothetical protein
MATQDTTQIKEKIITFLKNNGPSLPIQISKEIQMDSLFSSAFLSELLSEHKIKISKMKVGTSPIYYLQETQNQLEKYSEHLNFKEKEAHNLLKENKFLINEQQLPAIRVALASIPDFAKSFESNNKLIWRYFTTSQEDYLKKEIKKTTEKETVQNKNKLQIPQSMISEIKKNFSKEKEEIIKISPKPKIEKKKTTRKKPNQKKNEKFFNIVKEYLTSKQIEIIDIEGFSKDNLMLRIKTNDEEKILIAYNKKRISEKEIIEAHKKSKETNLKYIILSFGEPLKKTNNFIEAIKQLDHISKIE